MKLRKATLQDAKLLFVWRTDPVTMAASHNAGEISFDEHLNWFRASLENPKRQIFIAEEGGVAIGTVRVDAEEESSELSWTVAPDQRGRGVATLIVTAVAKKIQTPIRAEVKEGNIASIRVAEAAGMGLVRKDGNVLHFFRQTRLL